MARLCSKQERQTPDEGGLPLFGVTWGEYIVTVTDSSLTPLFLLIDAQIYFIHPDDIGSLNV